MAIVRTEAVVLGGFPYSETSRILRLYTERFGLQSVMAKGVRRPRSRLASALETFAHIEVQYYKRPGRTLFTLSSADLLSSHRTLARELPRFAAASLLVEFLRRLAAEEDGQPATFHWILEGLAWLEQEDLVSLEPGLWTYQWGLLRLAGFEPELVACLRCRRPPAKGKSPAFDLRGGVVCGRCLERREGTVALSRALYQAVLLLVKGGPHLARRVRLDEDDRKAVRSLLSDYLAWQTGDDHPLRALELMEQLEGSKVRKF